MRLRVDFAYDGTDFSGWAAQPGRRAVESELSAALSRVLRAPEPVRLVVAGRTDAGVHAAGAVCHADVDEAAFAALPGRSDRTPREAAVTRLNGVLPPDVVVRDVQVAPEGFDARFSALRRRYRYRLCDDVRRLDPVRRRDTVVHKRALDVAAMDAAARNLLGLHDFAAFCKKREGATTVRTLLDYSWVRGADGVLEATVVADAFCHSMVRSLVGALLAVGDGSKPIAFPRELLAASERSSLITVAPARGLTLIGVEYPPDNQLAARNVMTRGRRDLEHGSNSADAPS